MSTEGPEDRTRDDGVSPYGPEARGHEREHGCGRWRPTSPISRRGPAPRRDGLLPWPAPEALLLKFVARSGQARGQRPPWHAGPRRPRAEGLLRIEGPHALATVRRRASSWSTLWRRLEGSFASPALHSALRLAVRASGRPAGARAGAPSAATFSSGWPPPAAPTGLSTSAVARSAGAARLRASGSSSCATSPPSRPIPPTRRRRPAPASRSGSAARRRPRRTK